MEYRTLSIPHHSHFLQQDSNQCINIFDTAKNKFETRQLKNCSAEKHQKISKHEGQLLSMQIITKDGISNCHRKGKDCTQKMLIKILYFYTRSDTLFKMAMHTRNT